MVKIEESAVIFAPDSWNYTHDDFINGTAPYDEVYKFKDDNFKHGQAIQAMAAHASKVKFAGFKGVYKEFYKQKVSTSNVVSIDNATSFQGQEISLDCGEWEADDTGIYKDGQFGRELVCHHPIMPVERLVNIDTGLEKIRLAYKKGNRWMNTVVDKSVLASSQKITSLASLGIAVTSENARLFVAYLSDLENLNYNLIPEVKTVSRLGYVDGEGFLPYVDDLIFDGDASFESLYKDIAQVGSRDTWIETAKRCRAMSLETRIVLASSFASPLLDIVGALPFFVHLWCGTSGTGKTVSLMLGASVWGNPEVGNYIKTFNTTKVGLETMSAFLNHMPMCIDELQLSKDKKGNSNFSVYELAQGVGKTRSNTNLGIARTLTWRNCVMSTGESPITSASDGAGAVNRVLDIECSPDKPIVTDGPAVSGALKLNYGHAGKEFVEMIYSNEKIIELVKNTYTETFEHLTKLDTTEKQAMAAAAILTADKLATTWFFKDGLQLTEDDLAQFLASKKSVSMGERGYQFLCDWVSQNGHKLCGQSDVSEVYGTIENNEAFIIRNVFDRTVNDAGFSSKALISYLKQNSLIRVRAKNNTLGKRINGRNVECVCLKLATVENDDYEEEML